jgi:hypothetical protein
VTSTGTALKFADEEAELQPMKFAKAVLLHLFETETAL